MVMPGMVYLSQPTEFGTLYSLRELEEISGTCHKYGIPLYIDGARLAYALACPENDVTLPDLARLCDAFYIGGTKCGALFGETVVFPRKDTLPHFFTIVKQHGALLAKGRIAGIQFDTLFTDGLYERIGQNAIRAAERIRGALREKGYRQAFEAPTNQIFIVLDRKRMRELSERVEMSFWESIDRDHVVMRIVTSWATQDDETDRLISCL
jgi:threonine aldolase